MDFALISPCRPPQGALPTSGDAVIGLFDAIAPALLEVDHRAPTLDGDSLAARRWLLITGQQRGQLPLILHAQLAVDLLNLGAHGAR
jgi:hypothetical protein